MKVTHNGKELFEVVIPDKIPDEIEIEDMGQHSGWDILAIGAILGNCNIIVNEQNLQEFMNEHKGDKK